MPDPLKREAQEHFELGNRMDESGDRDGAIREWLEAIALDRDHSSAHFNLGIAYADEGDLEHGINELKQVIHLEPYDMNARRELAQMLFEVERADEAIDQLRQVLNTVQNDPESAHMLAEAYIQRKEWDKAEGALDSGAMLEQDADLWYQIGQARLAQNQRQDAILAFRRSLVCDSDHRDSEQMLRQLHVAVEEQPESEE